MNTFTIEATNKTPFICADPIKGTIDITGRSIPANPIEFYRPLMDWVDEYDGQNPNRVQVNIQVDFINTSSSKCLMAIFKRLDLMSKKGKDVAINWYYNEDDEEIFTVGSDYKGLVSCPLNLVEVI
ncbi:MAG: DUF1987 domain-containing protein [Bacteroidales bacterium]|jgi:hypothetical protein|nr:DUF1987 domain-containing protein [Bacteroidales bacterium]MBP5419329.1 DUF1987 domain-containing protein [Bacteroidales bacterium]MCR5696490.1 DUF1987 domain-containing protein [Marinilabiliaceae bacterium]